MSSEISDPVRTTRFAATRNRPRADDRIIVGQLFASFDRPPRTDPDRLVDDLKPAVRRARVVDEAREAAADVGVPAPRAVDAKDPDAAFLEVPLLSRLALLVISDQLACVVDDARVLFDGLRGKH